MSSRLFIKSRSGTNWISSLVSSSSNLPKAAQISLRNDVYRYYSSLLSSSQAGKNSSSSFVIPSSSSSSSDSVASSLSVFSPVIGASLTAALIPLHSSSSSRVRATSVSLSRYPLFISKRYFSYGLRMSAANLVTRRLDNQTIKQLEYTANREAGNVTAQILYLQALQNNGYGDEVISRVESGRFATTWTILDLYLRCLNDHHRISSYNVNDIRHRLRMVWEQYTGGTSSNAAAVIPGEAIRNAVYGGNSNGYGGSSVHNNNPSYMLPSSSSSGSMSSSFNDNYSMGSTRPQALGNIFTAAANHHNLPNGGSGSSSNGGGGNYGGSNGYSDTPGTRGNPMVVEVQPSKASMISNIVRLIAMAVVFTLLYQYASRSMPSPLANLTGDITEEVTDTPTTRFNDVKGVDEAKAELEDVVAFLRDPERFKRLGAKVPRGILLTGPPGTGKTLLARAVAGEAGCRFYSKSASEFEEMLVGLGAKRVRELFAAAKKNAPAIIFIDEIDALGGKRKVSIGAGSERQTLNQLLSSMDGFTKNENVIVIAATNSPDILDPALTRPGRFDSTVDVPLPDVKGRKEILDLYLTKVIVGEDLDSELLAKATPGFSGAQLEALINSAALMAANRGAQFIETQDVEEARDKLIMGPAKKSRVRRAETMKLTAYHEGGHTLTALLTKGADPLHKVTILPRGFSGGATYSLPKDDELATKESILAQIDVCMGGRAAEELIYGENKITTGAGMDMSQASDLARRFCSVYSMSELGLSSYGNTEPSADRKAAIDTEVEKILRTSYNRVFGLMSNHKSELDRLATALLEYETLTAEECEKVVGGQKLPSLKDKISTLRRERDSNTTSSGTKVQTSQPSPTKSKNKGTNGNNNNKDTKDTTTEPQPKNGIWASVFGGSATVTIPNTNDKRLPSSVVVDEEIKGSTEDSKQGSNSSSTSTGSKDTTPSSSSSKGKWN